MSRESLAVMLLCLAAFLIRLAYVSTLPREILWFDGERFSALATGLLHHGTYGRAPGHPSAWWPPGYPFLIAAVYAVFGPNPTAVRIVQCVIGASTVALVARIARRALDVPGRLVAAAATAVYPFYIYTAGALLSTTLETALLAATVLLALVATERRSVPSAVSAGVFGACATLTAGSALPALLLFALWMIGSRAEPTLEPGPRTPRVPAPDAGIARPQGGDAHRGTVAAPPRNVRLAVCYLLPFVLLLGGWALRNERAFHHPVLISTNFGYNLWLGNYPGVTAATGNRDSLPGMTSQTDSIWLGPGNEATRDHAFLRLAVGYVAADVPRFLRLTLDKALLLWSPYAEPMTQYRPRVSFERPASLLSYGLLMPFALVWLFRSLKRDRLSILVLLLFLTYTLEHGIILSKVRFRLPLDTFVIIYGSGGLVALIRSVNRHLRPKRHVGAGTAPPAAS